MKKVKEYSKISSARILFLLAIIFIGIYTFTLLLCPDYTDNESILLNIFVKLGAFSSFAVCLSLSCGLFLMRLITQKYNISKIAIVLPVSIIIFTIIISNFGLSSVYAWYKSSGTDDKPIIFDCKAVITVLLDTGETAEITGIGKKKIYKVISGGGRIPATTTYYYTLEMDNGLTFPLNGMTKDIQIYSVTYSVSTGLPKSIVAYSPDTDTPLIEISEVADKDYPNWHGITIGKCEVNADRFILRAYANGKVLCNEKVTPGTSVWIPVNHSGTTIQIYAVYDFAEIPVSNMLVVD